jgi:hypothetical protein
MPLFAACFAEASPLTRCVLCCHRVALAGRWFDHRDIERHSAVSPGAQTRTVSTDGAPLEQCESYAAHAWQIKVSDLIIALQAETVAAELTGTDSSYADPTKLKAKLDGLELLLPGLNILAVVYDHGPEILDVSLPVAAQRLVHFKQALNCSDAVQLVQVAPQLLVTQDVEERLAVAIARLQRLLPGQGLRSIQKAIVQAPTVIFRFDISNTLDDGKGLPDDILELFLA